MRLMASMALLLDHLLPMSTALAQSAAAGAQQKSPSMIEMLAMPVGFLLIMYFFIIRPQQRKAKEQSDLITNLKAGDEVVTTGGIIGKVRSVAEGFVTLEVANNTAIKVLKTNVTAFTKAPAQAVKEPVKA
jgi:preprotein translocase subunit YajC